jgi:hypothetical protein
MCEVLLAIACSIRMNHPSVVSVGIDVGKAKLDVACVREDRTALHQVFSNTEKGIGALARFLKQQRTAVTVPCVLEATGDYHLLVSLEHFPIRLGVSRVCEISFAFFFGNRFQKRGDCSPKLFNFACLHFA